MSSILKVFKSKKYCKDLNINHKVEEKDNYIYFIVEMGKLEIRRLKFDKKKKRKIQTLQFDLRRYLEDAYKNFEVEQFK